LINIILCGGSGTRLWPISRTAMPKQFVKFFDGESLFQKTVKRNVSFCEELLVVSSEMQYFLALDELVDAKAKAKFLLEPVGRNTAPAIALAAMSVPADEILLVSPSDHLIKNESAYKDACLKAKELALSNYLVTFGISPSAPETGFGYIEADGYDVVSFKEKPTTEVAKEYIASGRYYWNSGMFCFKADVYLEELTKHAPQMFAACEKAFKNAKNDVALRVLLDDMQAIPSDSIDYAVMEKSDKVKVVPCDIGWSDVGSFDAIFEEFDKDELGSVLPVNTIAIDSKECFVSSDRVTALVCVEDLIIVDTKDALLVCKKNESQKVKEVVARLKKEASELCDTHTTVHRPWGNYAILEEAAGFKIKKIIVKPGERLSLQKHVHRNEHWIVVSGTAKVTVEGNAKMVRANESTYINMGEWHRLENEGKIDLVLIEAQVGQYLGEDDIVRLEDDYQRHCSIKGTE
jgi:mannose-1-phosphate guanylyltransferase